MISLKLKYSLPLLLVTLLCIGGVEAFYHVLGKRFTPERVAAAPSAQEVQSIAPSLNAARKKTDVRVISRRNLFSSQESTAGSHKITDPLEGVEPSSLDVVLMGTVTGPDERQRAVIYDKKEKKQDMYQVGEFIYEAVIKNILRGKVILTLNGRDEMLDITEARTIKIARIPPAIPSTTVKRVVGRPVGAQSQQTRRSFVPAAAKRATSKSEPLRSFRGGVILKGQPASAK